MAISTRSNAYYSLVAGPLVGSFHLWRPHSRGRGGPGKADHVRDLSKGGCVKMRTRGQGVIKSLSAADVINGRPRWTPHCEIFFSSHPFKHPWRRVKTGSRKTELGGSKVFPPLQGNSDILIVWNESMASKGFFQYPFIYSKWYDVPTILMLFIIVLSFKFPEQN